MGLLLGSIACVVVLYLGALVLTKKQTPEKDRPGNDNIAAVIIVLIFFLTKFSPNKLSF